MVRAAKRARKKKKAVPQSDLPKKKGKGREIHVLHGESSLNRYCMQSSVTY